jgi:prevent-host-death family protein
MKTIKASKFKTQCLGVMQKVQSTGEPILVTKRGNPMVKIVPAESGADNLFGFMASEFDIIGDIESPLVPLKEWQITKK